MYRHKVRSIILVCLLLTQCFTSSIGVEKTYSKTTKTVYAHVYDKQFFYSIPMPAANLTNGYLLDTDFNVIARNIITQDYTRIWYNGHYYSSKVIERNEEGSFISPKQNGIFSIDNNKHEYYKDDVLVAICNPGSMYEPMTDTIIKAKKISRDKSQVTIYKNNFKIYSFEIYTDMASYCHPLSECYMMIEYNEIINVETGEVVLEENFKWATANDRYLITPWLIFDLQCGIVVAQSSEGEFGVPRMNDDYFEVYHNPSNSPDAPTLENPRIIRYTYYGTRVESIDVQTCGDMRWYHIFGSYKNNMLAMGPDCDNLENNGYKIFQIDTGKMIKKFEDLQYQNSGYATIIGSKAFFYGSQGVESLNLDTLETNYYEYEKIEE